MYLACMVIFFAFSRLYAASGEGSGGHDQCINFIALSLTLFITLGVFTSYKNACNSITPRPSDNTQAKRLDELHLMSLYHQCGYIPYSGFILWEKFLRILRICPSLRKYYSRILHVCAMCACTCSDSGNPRKFYSRNTQMLAIHEKFSPAK